jgi:hypothetical protein
MRNSIVSRLLLSLIVTGVLFSSGIGAATPPSASPRVIAPPSDQGPVLDATESRGFVTIRSVTGTDPAGDLDRTPDGLWGETTDPPTGSTVTIEFPQWFIGRDIDKPAQFVTLAAWSPGELSQFVVFPWTGTPTEWTRDFDPTPERVVDLASFRMEKAGTNWRITIELVRPIGPDVYPTFVVHIRHTTGERTQIQVTRQAYGYSWAYFNPDATFETYLRGYHDLAGATIEQIDSDSIEIEVVAHEPFPSISDASLDETRYVISFRDAFGNPAGSFNASLRATGWSAYYQPTPRLVNIFDWDPYWRKDESIPIDSPTVDGNRIRLRAPLSLLPLRNEMTTGVLVRLFLNTPVGRFFVSSVDSMNLDRMTINDAPEIVVSALPGSLLQTAGEGGASTFMTLTNVGAFETTLSLSRVGDFFTIDPPAFPLGPGASQQIVITGLPISTGHYLGSVIPSGLGVPAGLTIPVQMLVAEGSETSKAVPESNRVDLAAPAEQQVVEGTVGFTNVGDGPLTGLVASDVPWLGIVDPLVVLDSQQSRQIEFVIDRALRPDGDDPFGSVTATIALQYLDGAGSAALAKLVEAQSSGASVSTTLVTVTDTAKPSTTIAAPPSLPSNQIAIFLSGLGHVRGGVGTFISDLHLTTLQRLTNLTLYYTPVGEALADSTRTSIQALSRSQPVLFADMSRNIFNQESGLGTLQIRGLNLAELVVSASVFNKSNPAGTYGSAIPPLRSDRAVAPGEKLFIPGLVGSSPAGRTNLIVQETSGKDASVIIEFLDPAGAVVSSSTRTVPAFQHLRVNDAAPLGSVAVVITNDEGSLGKVLAYATPVDPGGDTWVVTDWPRISGYAPTETVIVPVAGRVVGRNENFFRTSLSVMNQGATGRTATVRFVPQDGGIMTRTVELGALETATWDDVMGELFDLSSALGFLEIDANGAPISVASRTFATIGDDPRQFGTGVPAVAASAMKLGDMKRISGFDDADAKTIGASMPATFRTNLGLVETSGKPVTLRITLHFRHPQSSKATVVGAGSREYNLGGHAFHLLNNVAKEILGPHRDLLQGNLKDLFLDVEIVSGEGTAIVFTSSVDNGTADQVFKLE